MQTNNKEISAKNTNHDKNDYEKTQKNVNAIKNIKFNSFSILFNCLFYNLFNKTFPNLRTRNAK